MHTTDAHTQGNGAMLGLPRQALRALGATLYRELGGGAAGPLQEAGYGAGLYDAFARWMAERHGTTPDQIGAERFPTELARFFADLGWGSLTFGTMGTVATLDSSDWAEGNPAHPMEFPACYFTAGLLTELFMRLSDVPVSALEVECRSAGAERCRFLVGSSETIQRVYDGLSAGVGYEANV